MPKLVSRGFALANGINRYFTGNECKHGHVSLRYTSTGGCCECVKGSQRPGGKHRVRYLEYQRKYQRARRAAYREVRDQRGDLTT